MNKIYDIAIIGLGPAGATLARLLDKKFSIIAFDKKIDAKDGFKKPCGGLLAEDAQKMLASFGFTLPVEVLADPQIFAVKTVDINSKTIKNYQRTYVNLDRHKFDLWLKSLIPARVNVINGAVCADIERENDGYKITLANGETYRAKYIAGADGAASAVRKKLFPHKKISSYLAVQQWFEDLHETPFYACIFDNNLTDCYSWGLTKDGKFIFGGAFPIKNGRENFEKLKTECAQYGFKLENPLKTEACLVLRPANPFQFCCGENGAFLIGEAAGFISPSSLEGLSYAFESAYILSEVFNSRDKNLNKKYRRKTFSMRLKLTLKLLKNPLMYNRFLRKLVMRSGIQALKQTARND